MYRLEITKPALRTLRRAPANVARRLREKIDQLARAPTAEHQNVKPLRGRPGYRLRIGDWRVVYELDHQQGRLVVLDIGPRSSVYD